ncbi:cyclic 2,3-diphosphoglycerate synthase [Thermococcus atlanticus]
MAEKKRKRVVILGAAGRDFHNFNTFFRDNPDYEVVAFTATQIPDIEGRIYPPELAGELYPNGIPIWSEDDLEKIIKEHDIDIVVFAYSDVAHEHVMHLASRAHSAGADFWLLGPKSTMLKSNKPVVAVTAVRTGCGKSQTSRKVAQLLQEMGYRVVAIRHPMPYGDLRKQIVQRFATYEDMDRYECTIEEREEYEPYIERGMVVYAGVDYEKILREAEKEADIILWDGGNNDFPFYVPDLWIVVTDPHRPGHELKYHPGETNFRAADVIIINKIDTANRDDIQTVRESIEKINPNAIVIDGASPLYLDKPELIKGKRVLVVEDGPTLTHGGMKYGAGYVAAKKFGAKEIIDPRPYAVGSIIDTYKKYSHLDRILPAMGYGKKQMEELEETINRADADVVVIGTPVDLRRFMKLNKPAVRVKYELEEIGQPKLRDILADWVKKCEKLKKE